MIRRETGWRRHRVAVAGVLVVLIGGTGCCTDHPTIAGYLDHTTPEGSSGTLAVVNGDQTVYCDGWGRADRESDVAADCDTVYDIMSMTKQFTAAAVLKLQAQGELAVTDRLDAYFDAVPEDKRAITVDHLLTHTSGLVDVLGGDYEPTTRQDLIHGAFRSELSSAPGEQYHYSNVGYSMLAAIIEEASGQSYEEYLAEHLFEPAGMMQTGYVLPTWDPDQIAVMYDAEGVPHGRPNDQPWASDGPYWNLRGNGGMLSTASDIVRWHRALDSGTVLDPQPTADLFEARVLEEPGGDTWYGYGWVVQDVDDQPVAWHNGASDWGYGEILRSLDSGVMVFWVTNQSRSTDGDWDLSEIAGDLTEGVLERIPA